MIAGKSHFGNRHSLSSRSGLSTPFAKIGTVKLPHFAPARGTPLGVRRWVPALRATLPLPLPKWGIILAAYALVTLACIHTATAENQGRLFFTPQQRSQLDHEFARNARTDGNSSSVLTVNGIVQKQGGPRTVWINGVAQTPGDKTEHNPTAQTVTVPGKLLPIKLKVGEKVLLDQAAPSAQESPAK